MRVLILRAKEDAERFARQLKAAGHSAAIAPLLEIVATGFVIPAGPFGLIVASSAHAFRLLPSNIATDLSETPVATVGLRTAESARVAGFSEVLFSENAAGALAQRIIASVPRAWRILYLAGRDRKPVLEHELRNAGFAIQTVIAYQAKATAELPAVANQMLAAGALDCVAHFSRRSAELFVKLVHEAGLQSRAASLKQVCLSQDVAAALAELAPLNISCASTPDNAAMIRAIGATS